jgi:hypothetical protein
VHSRVFWWSRDGYARRFIRALRSAGAESRRITGKTPPI